MPDAPLPARLIQLHGPDHYAGVARRLNRAISAYRTGKIDALTLNGKVAQILVADPFAVMVVFDVLPCGGSRAEWLYRIGILAGADAGWQQRLAALLSDLQDIRVSGPSWEIARRLGAELAATLPVNGWLNQIGAISDKVALAGREAYDDFRLMLGLRSQISALLGHEDLGRAAADPQGQSSGKMQFVDLFATAPLRQADAWQALSWLEAQPKPKQPALLAWFVNGSFEYYMGMGPIPADLPPAMAVTAPGIAQLYRQLTGRLMADFAVKAAATACPAN